MPVVDRSVVILTLFPILAGLQSCHPLGTPGGTYKVNTFNFVLSEPNSSEPAPSLWIDTNTKLSGLFGGTLTSSLPCSVKIDYTDNSFSLKNAVIKSLKITYDDGTVDSSTDSLKLPMLISSRNYETVNSVAGGRVVKSTVRIISGEIPDVITRIQPCTIQMEGHFNKDDGSTLPFTIEQHYHIKKENTVKKAEEVLQDK